MYILKSKMCVIILGVVAILIITLVVISSKSRPSKESIIKTFNENYKMFSDIEKNISEQNSIIVYKKNDEVVFSLSEQGNNINNSSVKNQAEYILNKLHFQRILKKDGPALKSVIVFERTIGYFEQGIVYLKDDSGKYDMEMVKIRDGWYYYSIGNV